jgi:hypothetical protein
MKVPRVLKNDEHMKAHENKKKFSHVSNSKG